MGGMGSGDWYRSQGKKATVEESLAVSMSAFRGRVFQGATGALTWTWPNGRQSSLGYFVTWNHRPTITLHYRWGNSEDVQIPVQLQTTPTHFGGERWWLTCPLCIDGVACNRRTGKLYLPPGAKYFGCRTCHNLSYRSTQQAHAEERRMIALARLEDMLADLESSRR